MNTTVSNHYVLLTCSATEAWAVPQACLGEIVTVPGEQARPPEQIEWRGRDIPVLDRGAAVDGRWRDARGENGLVAVMLTLPDHPGESWGVALRSEGLAITTISPEEAEDEPEALGENARAAFRYRNVVYQVPDLRLWQEVIAQRGCDRPIAV